MTGALTQLFAHGKQDLYLTGSCSCTYYNLNLPRYYRDEEISLYYSENYPYTFRLNLEE